jgi:N-acetylglucosaminyldiphosphoundecaprenol N-acetyl-beta-D-mannosaminyltransferase
MIATESPNPSEPSRVSIFGTPIQVATYQSMVELVNRWSREPGVKTVAAVNVHNVTLAAEDPRHAANLKTFDAIVPDGMPLVWWINRFSAHHLKDRVYGPSLMLHCLDASQQWEGSNYLLGSTPEVLKNLQIKLHERFPKAKIAGVYSPPFGEWSAEENTKIFQLIRASGARFIWVGLGCPKQERWLAIHKPQLPEGIYFGVGAAFPMHAGMLRQAPGWMQRNGLEWIFRLIMEPKRMWLRTVKYNTLFTYHTIRHVMGKKPSP